MRSVIYAWIALLYSVAVVFAAAPRTLPVKPDVLPDFHVPRENSRALDENWVYVQTLYDASQSTPQYWGAVPVGFTKANQGRAFIAALHTIFRTTDGGRTWTNLDPQPAPAPSPAFNSLRSPSFISDITWRLVTRPEAIYDSLYISLFNTFNNGGTLRLMRGVATQHVMWPESLFALRTPRWLTSIAAPDSNIAVALSGLDARIYRNDSMFTSQSWDTLPERFTGTWVNEVTTVANIIYAVGSLQWLSLDRGFSWQTIVAADPLGDTDIDFAPNSARGIVCSGQDSPPFGWAHFTTDFGQEWSPRTLQTNIPLRTALFVNDTLGYVAGGIANNAVGRVWRTTDGGATWQLELEVDAEITELGYARESGGYVNIIAAGYFADFRCGVWRSHIPLPDANGVAAVFSQDTLVFFAPAGQSASQEVSLKNVGAQNFTITDWFDVGPFQINCCIQDVLLQPGDSMIATVTFSPDTAGDYANGIRVFNDSNEFLELRVLGSTLTSATPSATLPTELSLSVYPNPGNSAFRLSYVLARNSNATLNVFDVTGREVATLVNEAQSAGEHIVSWNASAQASGIYFAALEAANSRTVSKLVLMK